MTKEAIKTFQYRITRATGSQLVVILYDMCLEYLNDAKNATSEEEEKNNLYMATKVIDKLIVGLDMQYEISINLFKIYNHVKRTIIANFANTDISELDRVESLLRMLRTSFNEVSKQDESAPLMKNTETVYAGLTYSRMGSSNELRSGAVSNRGFIA